VVVVVLGTALYVTGRQAGATADAAVSRALAATRSSVADALAGRSEQLRDAAQVLALQTPYISRIEAALAEGDRGNLIDQVNEFTRQTRVDWTLLTDPAGVLAAWSYQVDAFGDPLGEGALVGLPLSDGRTSEGLWIEVGPGGGDLLFQAVGVPIFRPQSTALVGVLVLARAIDSAFVSEIKAHTNSDVVFFTLDTLGVPRAVLGTLPAAAAAPLLDSVRLSEDTAAAGDTTLVRGAVAGEEMVGAVGALRSAAGFPLGGFLALRSRSAEMAAFTQLRRIILIAFGGGLVLALLSSLILARQITRPVRALVAATDKVREGQFSGKVETRSRDEIGDLARAFDHMLKELRDKQQLVEFLQSSGDRTVPLSTVGGEATVVARAPRPSVTGVLETGQVLGNRYEVKALLGQGGMGMVYRAFDRQLGEMVALKTLRPELVASDSTTLERFKQEIRLARRITHRNVVRTHDLGEVDGMYFITMEYVAGTNLKELIRQRGKVPVGITLTIGKQLCRALEVAHEQNVIHRDVKPHNIAVEPSGFIKVMDFGIARLMERTGGEGLTQAGTTVGTPEYMAPEQLMGEAVDARADLYATGAVLFECLTGRIVFQAPSLTALIARHLEDEPQNPRELNPQVPEPLAAAVLKALAKKPDQRWSSAAELAEELEKIGV
jgi:serine/threonine-protein kinase